MITVAIQHCSQATVPLSIQSKIFLKKYLEGSEQQPMLMCRDSHMHSLAHNISHIDIHERRPQTAAEPEPGTGAQSVLRILRSMW